MLHALLRSVPASPILTVRGARFHCTRVDGSSCLQIGYGVELRSPTFQRFWGSVHSTEGHRSTSMAITNITVRGARQHNLKNIDVVIPRNTLTVITGLSGSGKSSLAFDTIYAEGQRRYVETLSAYARQFLDQMERPDVDAIDGLSPSISIEQKTTSRSPRSTVGTITEIYDYLRLLFASIGVPHCPNCGRAITRQSAEQIVERIAALSPGERITVYAPIVRGRKGEFREELEALDQQGFRARIDGEMVELTEGMRLEKRKNHTIEAIVDRIILKPLPQSDGNG